MHRFLVSPSIWIPDPGGRWGLGAGGLFARPFFLPPLCPRVFLRLKLYLVVPFAHPMNATPRFFSWVRILMSLLPVFSFSSTRYGYFAPPYVFQGRRPSSHSLPPSSPSRTSTATRLIFPFFRIRSHGPSPSKKKALFPFPKMASNSPPRHGIPNNRTSSSSA